MRTRVVRAVSLASLLAVTLAAPSMAEVVDGTAGPDTLVGTAKADTIHGYKGDDTLLGKRGSDKLYGGAGADRIYGGRDHKKDLLYGGPGPDHIVARYIYEEVYAGRGNDTITLYEAGSFGGPWIHCGPGRDHLTIIAPSAWGVASYGCEDSDWRPPR